MKITCPRCSSVYKIDGAALSQEGTYLKCARCSNIFFARRRSKSEAERLRTSRVKQRVAAPVAAPQAFERPEPVQEQISPVMPETSPGGVSALEEFVLAPAETPESVMDAGLGDITLEEEAPPPPSVQDDIDAILRASAPRAEPEAPAPQAIMSNDDIESLLAANAPKEEEEPVLEIAIEEEPASPSAQDDIDALLRANAPKAEPEAPAPQAIMSNDDIEALLAANAPKEEEKPVLEIAIEEEPASHSAQDDIDALLAAHAPKDETVPATKQAPSPQDDIDALMAAHAPKQEEEEALDDIDALLAGVAGGEAPPAPRVEEEEEPAPEPSPAAGFARPQEETDIISQDDIDALLKSSGDDVAVDETGGEEEEVEIPIIEEPGDELDKLLGSKDDSVGEDLFGEGETVSVSPGAVPSLDDMLATETVAVEPGDSGEETIDTDAVLGIPSAPAGRRAPPAEEALFEPIEEVEEPPARAGVMDKVMALFGTLMGLAAGALVKFRLPGLSPRLGKAVAAVAVVAVVALAGGGYWFFFGHKAGAPVEETAGKEGEAKPAGQEEAAAPLGESLLASTGMASQQEPAMSFTIYLPVEFDAEISRVMKLDMTMIFENFEIRDDAMQRAFYLTVQVENTVDAFFEDKFYTDTVFAQDKLEEFLNEKLKAMAPMAGLRQARVDGISFEEEAAAKPETPAGETAAAPGATSAAP